MKFNTSNNPIIRATTTLSDGITGYQGGKIYWNLKDGVLTLTGTGNMPSISSPEKAPWHAYKDTITKVVVKQGVTSVSTNAFAGLTNLETAEIGEGVTAIGTYAFKATKIKTVSLPSTLKTVGTSAFSNCPYVTNVIYNGTSDAFAKVTVNGGNSRFNSATKKFN